MQAALDAILEGITDKPDRASDMRHALLYMAFPEDYERSISTRDKVRIVEHYGEDVPDLAADVDQGLKQVREHRSRTAGTWGRVRLRPDLKDEWRPVEQPKKGTSGAPSAESGELIELGAGFDPSKDDVFQEAMLTLGQTRHRFCMGRREPVRRSMLPSWLSAWPGRFRRQALRGRQAAGHCRAVDLPRDTGFGNSTRRFPRQVLGFLSSNPCRSWMPDLDVSRQAPKEPDLGLPPGAHKPG